MRRSIWFLIAALLLTSCLGQNVASTSTPDAQMVMTSVQLTVSEKLTSNAASIPSATLTPTVTETIISTTAATATPTPTVLTTLTQTTQTTQTGFSR